MTDEKYQEAFKDGYADAHLAAAVVDGVRNWAKMIWREGDINKEVGPNDDGWYSDDEVEASILSYIREAAKKQITFTK